MANLFHNFPIQAPIDKVFEMISTPSGLDNWWTKTSAGKCAIGETFHFHFEPDYNWSAIISKCIKNKEIEFTMKISDEDWMNTKIGFELNEMNDSTHVKFYHSNWPEENEHYRISNFCWAMYLRILKRYLEFGEFIPYANRLEV